MRPLPIAAIAATALLLAAGVVRGEGARGGSEAGSERAPRPSLDGPRDRTPPSLPVNTPVRTFRVPSRLATGPAPLPSWLRTDAPADPRDAPRTPLRTAASGTFAPGFEAGAQERILAPYEFYFTRAAYSGSRGGWGRGQAWATDYPKADRQFMVVLRRLTNLDAFPDENAVLLTDPALRDFPFLYALEVGYMNLRDEEIRGLRDYLNAGGFLMVDDFWGYREWATFEYHMARVLPGRVIQDLPMDHPIFDLVYDVSEVLQVPALGRGIYGRPTWERPDARVPTVSGIFDDHGRLMVVINWNTDLGDAWEHAENPMYPVEYSTYAFQVGVNTIVYGMSH